MRLFRPYISNFTPVFAKTPQSIGVFTFHFEMFLSACFFAEKNGRLWNIQKDITT